MISNADAFFFCLRLNQVVDAVDGFLKIEFFIRKCKLIALNFGHVQDVIDEAQQVTGWREAFSSGSLQLFVCR